MEKRIVLNAKEQQIQNIISNYSGNKAISCAKIAKIFKDSSNNAKEQ